MECLDLPKTINSNINIVINFFSKKQKNKNNLKKKTPKYIQLERSNAIKVILDQNYQL